MDGKGQEGSGMDLMERVGKDWMGGDRNGWERI